MGVLIERDIQHNLAVLLGVEEANPYCFRCGDVIEEPIVFWWGNGSSITLHPECATRLGCSLIGDAQAVKASMEAVR